jgi:hypothetical protein
LVVPFEVEELGNTHIREEASKILQCEPTLEAVKKAITDKWGANAKTDTIQEGVRESDNFKDFIF